MSAEDGKDGAGIPRPVNWWLHQYLSGQMQPDKIPQAVLSWSRFFIFEGAREIVLMDDKYERIAALAKIPAPLRVTVENEVKRLWPMRASL